VMVRRRRNVRNHEQSRIRIGENLLVVACFLGGDDS